MGITILQIAGEERNYCNFGWFSSGLIDLYVLLLDQVLAVHCGRQRTLIDHAILIPHLFLRTFMQASWSSQATLVRLLLRH